ncbi:MAG: prenyltransferase [Bacteroidales bacterium]|nr:prenyltransferase [Bacteroidales bacterium]
MKRLLYWIQNARAYALPQSVLPGLVALCLPIGDPAYSVWLGLLAIFIVAIAHLSMNLFDDYFDFQTRGNEIREELEQQGIRARIAKSPYLVSGEVTPKQLFIVASLFALTALLLGLVIVWQRGMVPLYIAAAAGFLGYFYSGRPLRLSYHGFGELIIGTVFGPLLMCGVFYATVGYLNSEILYLSCAIGLLVINILFTHSILDYKPDIANGKRTLAAVLQRPALNLAASALFNFMPYLLVVIAVATHALSPLFLLTLLPLPLSLHFFYLMVQFCHHPEKEFPRQWWFGPIEHWDQIEEAGLGWFAIRWFYARNILQWISILIILCSVIRYFLS